LSIRKGIGLASTDPITSVTRRERSVDSVVVVGTVVDTTVVTTTGRVVVVVVVVVVVEVVVEVVVGATVIVGRVGIEPTTCGLRVRCSAS
tara:strand:- start:264 stop:533 length:270 start_codon:yes stop_codon:yes gene_type:complete